MVIFVVAMVVESAGNEIRSKVSLPPLGSGSLHKELLNSVKTVVSTHQGRFDLFNYKQLNASGLWRRRQLSLKGARRKTLDLRPVLHYDKKIKPAWDADFRARIKFP